MRGISLLPTDQSTDLDPELAAEQLLAVRAFVGPSSGDALSKAARAPPSEHAAMLSRPPLRPRGPGFSVLPMWATTT